MRKLLLVFVFAQIIAVASAQVSFSVNVTTPGGLSSAIKAAGGNIGTISNLTVTGTIDARDFKTMRDGMLYLTVVDLSSVSIAAYTGIGGTVNCDLIHQFKTITGIGGTVSRENFSQRDNAITARIFGGTVSYDLTMHQFDNSTDFVREVNREDFSYTANAIPPNAFVNQNIFSGGTTISSIIIPSSVTSIGASAFNNCSNLNSVTIPSSVTSIGASAFKNCSNLNSVTIPNSVTSIGACAFYGCSNLNSVAISNSVTYIREGTFNGCFSLKAVKIPNSVISISSYAFSNCIGLKSVTIPNSVTSISSYAFSNCLSLKLVTIPYSVTTIAEHAFVGCRGGFKVDANNPKYSSSNRVLFNKKQNKLMSCPTSKKGSYCIPQSVTSIGKYVFFDCDSLTSVTIPQSVTSIGDYAFFPCSGMLVVESGNTNYSSKNGVLFNKSKTKLIQCPTSKKGIYSIPNSVTFIKDYAFSYCSGLTSINIPNFVTSIGGNAFSYCSALTTVVIPNSVTSIGDNAFKGCSALKEITIPKSVISIEFGAFGCSGLTSIKAISARPVEFELGYSGDIFDKVDKRTCTLYVPIGSKRLYQAANQWKDFENIVEVHTENSLNSKTQPSRIE
ncbi:MAG: leucine-rich repeat domain-containing protein [Paludibacter sp.]|nr:leucine-rich repeat domain-containing protein [Paludibacter sp.]